MPRMATKAEREDPRAVKAIKEAKRFWKKVAKENGWADKAKKMTVTVWLYKKDLSMNDSLYNPAENTTTDYVVIEGVAR